MIKPDPGLRLLLQDIDKDRARVWALTNAYKTHANRVLQILNVEDLFDGVIYCDYQCPNFSCKPEPEFYARAMLQAGVDDPASILFIDDNLTNVLAAKAQRWGSCVWFYERENEVMEGGKIVNREHDAEEYGNGGVNAIIGNIQDIRTIWKDIFQ